MRAVSSFWASVQGDPKFMRKLNGWLTIFWIVMIPVSIVTGWISSVTYVAALSIWALVSGHWSTWQAARVGVTQQAEAHDREANPVEERVVEHLSNTPVWSECYRTRQSRRPANQVQLHVPRRHERNSRPRRDVAVMTTSRTAPALTAVLLAEVVCQADCRLPAK